MDILKRQRERKPVETPGGSESDYDLVKKGNSSPVQRKARPPIMGSEFAEKF